MYLVLKSNVKFESPGRLPAFKGNSIRGAFGDALRERACVYPNITNCKYCKLKHICGFSYIFNTFSQPGSNVLEKLDQISRPFKILSTDYRENFMEGDSFEFDLYLIGNGIKYIKQVVTSIESIKHMGSSRSKGFGSVVVSSTINDAEGAVFGERNLHPIEFPKVDFNGKVEFLTPTALISKERGFIYQPSLWDVVSFSSRKYSSIMQFHMGRRISIDFESLKKDLLGVEISKEALKGSRITKWSQTQGSRINMPAIYGEVCYDISKLSTKTLSTINSIFSVASITGIGRMTTAGYGHIHVE